jgi:secondary thiamine-phosphate synthase enzyme
MIFALTAPDVSGKNRKQLKKSADNQHRQDFPAQCNRREGISMKSYRKELWFEVPSRRALINITPQVEQCLRESGIKEGLVLCNAMHITASVFINDDEAGLHHDYDVWLEKLAPHEPVSQYRHNVGEDNADAHMKRQIMGREVVVAVTDGKLDFGTWERIFYGEFDGRRKKRVLVKIIGE